MEKLRAYILIFFAFFAVTAYAQLEEKTHETFFDTNKHNLINIEDAKLGRFINSLPLEKIEDVSIYGYCDDRGSDAYNQALSQRRADVIKTKFAEKGVSENIISNADGKGELLLTRLDDITNEIQRTLNRKVEIIVSFKQPPVTKEEAKKIEEEEIKKEEIKKEEDPSSYKTFPLAATDTIAKGDKLLLKNILFKTNYSYLHGKSYKDLRALTKFLKDNPQYIFKIQGHVCCVARGRDGVDLKTGKRNLSLARAKFVYNYLSKNGVDKKRMRYEGFGSKFPLGGDKSEDKRVEILVTYVKKVKKK